MVETINQWQNRDTSGFMAVGQSPWAWAWSAV